MSDQTPSTPDPASIVSIRRSDGDPEDLGATRSESESLIEDLQRVRAMCAAVTETVDGARMLLEETYRNCISLSNLIGMLQRRLAERVATGAQGRGSRRRRRGAPAEDEGGAYSEQELAALDRARLEGARLAARTAAHLISNDLTATVGLSEIVRQRVRTGTPVDPKLLDEAIASAKRAGRHLQDLQEIAGLEVEGGYGRTLSVLDLALSKRPPRA